jgi:hypothetical protein
VRPFEVSPSPLVERRTRQTSLAKYLLEVEAVGDDRTAAEDAYALFGEALASSDAFGLRLAVQNRVVREAEMAPVVEPGQAYTGRYLGATSMIGIDELYFDHRDWAEECFRGLAELLRPHPEVRMRLHAVDELVGVDRR